MTKKTTKKKEKPAGGITRTKTFAGVIRKGIDGYNTLIIKSQRWYKYQLQKFKDGENVTLEVHNRKSKRTEQQNKYYWGVYLPLVSKETNEPDLDRLHELFKGKFLTEGIFEVLGEKVRIKRSTTELGVGEFCQYILDIEHLTEVEAPPTENYELAPLREVVKKLSTGQ